VRSFQETLERRDVIRARRRAVDLPRHRRPGAFASVDSLERAALPSFLDHLDHDPPPPKLADEGGSVFAAAHVPDSGPLHGVGPVADAIITIAFLLAIVVVAATAIS
jgi:hypothetical protein